MIRQGFGRLLAALVAAGGVHALLLLNLHLPMETGGASSLQVDLVAAEKQSTADPVEEKGEAAPAKALSASGSESPHPAPSEIAATTTDAAEPARAEQAPQVAYHSGGQVEEAADSGQPTPAAGADEMVQAPVEVQAAILAHVSYPRLARRRGWEGQVHLRFDVSGRAVTSVTMLKPCRHPALNEAAEAGLKRVQRVALADGRYWLPVIFRLHEGGL